MVCTKAEHIQLSARKNYNVCNIMSDTCRILNAVQMPQIQQRRDTSHVKELNHEQGHKDDPWKGSPK